MEASIIMNRKKLKFRFLMNLNLLGNFLLQVQAYLVCTLHYCASQILHFVTNQRLAATLHQASLSAPSFLTAFAHFVSLQHILVILIFQTFSYFLCWSVISEWPLMLLMQLLGGTTNHVHLRQRTYLMLCIFWMLHQLTVFHLSPSPPASLFPEI